MPYKVEGKNLLHLKNGTWTVKQHASSHENAVKAMHLLYGLESGWKPSKAWKLHKR